MAITPTTIKRLYAKSGNRCAYPGCRAPIIVNHVPVGEMCHIRARRKNGPRFDPTLTLTERDDFPNLLLLCRTCHKIVDSDPAKYTPDLLSDFKSLHERSGDCEISPEIASDALTLLQPRITGDRTSATVRGAGVAVAVGGDNMAPINITTTRSTKQRASKYPANSIGADANLCGYIDYLFGLGIEYWDGVDDMNAGRLGRKIKVRFRLKSKTRNHLSVDRFKDLASFIVTDILATSPAGKRHIRNGTKLCRSFEEWRHDPMH